MADSVVFSVRVDPDVKREAAEVFGKLGLSLNAGIDIYLRAVARNQAVPFNLSLEPSGAVEYHSMELR